MPGRATTWRDILSELCDQIGYYTIWFNGDGIPQAIPTPDLSTAVPDITYGTQADGITLEPVRTNKDYGRVANRVHVASTAAGVTTPLYATADADVLFPGHPLSQGVIGFYLDHETENSVCAEIGPLEVQAYSILVQLLSAYQTVAFDTLAMPVHEAFDVVGVQVDDDVELGVVQVFHERVWSMDLVPGTMKHELRRLSDV